ncbi:hypothetical protein QYM36_012947 [Artemia franciscana]|uniref:C3H1-type domain-containing protein n=1 Tax=Artemia franciscana TaxID=6661 RepID=A0AA88L0S2_ARTSF|nr:hypothetical protein QYM36_012947 [Artemia franciscana]
MSSYEIQPASPVNTYRVYSIEILKAMKPLKIEFNQSLHQKLVAGSIARITNTPINTKPSNIDGWRGVKPQPQPPPKIGNLDGWKKKVNRFLSRLSSKEYIDAKYPEALESFQEASKDDVSFIINTIFDKIRNAHDNHYQLYAEVIVKLVKDTICGEPDNWMKCLREIYEAEINKHLSNLEEQENATFVPSWGFLGHLIVEDLVPGNSAEFILTQLADSKMQPSIRAIYNILNGSKEIQTPFLAKIVKKLQKPFISKMVNKVMETAVDEGFKNTRVSPLLEQIGIQLELDITSVVSNSTDEQKNPELETPGAMNMGNVKDKTDGDVKNLELESPCLKKLETTKPDIVNKNAWRKNEISDHQVYTSIFFAYTATEVDPKWKEGNQDLNSASKECHIEERKKAGPTSVAPLTETNLKPLKKKVEEIEDAFKGSSNKEDRRDDQFTDSLRHSYRSPPVIENQTEWGSGLKSFAEALIGANKNKEKGNLDSPGQLHNDGSIHEYEYLTVKDGYIQFLKKEIRPVKHSVKGRVSQPRHCYNFEKGYCFNSKCRYIHDSVSSSSTSKTNETKQDACTKREISQLKVQPTSCQNNSFCSVTTRSIYRERVSSVYRTKHDRENPGDYSYQNRSKWPTRYRRMEQEGGRREGWEKHCNRMHYKRGWCYDFERGSCTRHFCKYRHC